MNTVAFDSGFSPDYALVVNAYAGNHYLDFEDLAGTAKDAYLGTGAGSIFVSCVLSDDNTGLRAGFNDSNTGGITASSVVGADAVALGWEYELPFALLGVAAPTAGVVKVQAIVTGRMWESDPSSKWLSNQSLPGVRTNAQIQGQIGGGSLANYESVPGTQYLSYAYDIVPEPAVALMIAALLGLAARRSNRRTRT